MSYLISKMLPCLLVAGLLGALIGWLLKRGCRNRSTQFDDTDVISDNIYDEPQAQNREFKELETKLNIARLSAEDSQFKLDDYELKLKDSDLEIQSLNTKISGNDIVVQEYDLLKSKLSRAEHKIVDKENMLDSMKGQITISKDSQKELDSLKIQLKKADEDIQLYKQKFVDSKDLINHKDQEIKLLSGRLVESDTNLVSVKKDFSTIQQQSLLSTSSNNLEEVKPMFLNKPRDGEVDNLELIKGIGGKLHGVLNELGVYHFDQIAFWSGKEVNWVNEYLAFSGRIQREEWIPQAKDLMDGKVSEFAKRVDRGEVATSSSTIKPEFLKKPRDGKVDNLRLIKGVGKKLEAVLNELGVYHFDQIVSWNQKEINWVNDHLVFIGRIEREKWIPQAKDLMNDGETEFSKRVEKGEVPTSKKKK